MGMTWTKKAREEISHHIGRYDAVDLSRISFDKLAVKKNLRIKFVRSGLLYDPKKEYHLEYRCKDIDEANIILKELSYCDISGKLSINEKRNTILIYIVDVDTIIKNLKLLGANTTLKQYEKVVADKKRVGNTNRRVNFETANIKKSANASLRQLDDIKKLLKKRDLNSLDVDLRVVIKARMKHKTLSLAELAEKIGGVSKNALNHRFRKIRRMVENS